MRYSLLCSPPPTELEPNTAFDSEGFAEVYRGEDRAAKVGKLLPGTRYSFKLKVGARAPKLSDVLSIACWKSEMEQALKLFVRCCPFFLGDKPDRREPAQPVQPPVDASDGALDAGAADGAIHVVGEQSCLNRLSNPIIFSLVLPLS